jgi:hypothetical protein
MSMKSKEEVEAIAVELSKDVLKYNLTYAETMTVFAYLIECYSARVKYKTHEFSVAEILDMTSQIEKGEEVKP